jgi:hypothetical protein
MTSLTDGCIISSDNPSINILKVTIENLPRHATLSFVGDHEQASKKQIAKAPDKLFGIFLWIRGKSRILKDKQIQIRTYPFWYELRIRSGDGWRLILKD